jgi:hypothetical protein
MNSFSAIGSSALQNAQRGISRGMANLSRDQEIIASGGAGGPSGPTVLGPGGDAITGALIDAQQQKLDVEASVKALAITDQTLGTLLDITA